MNRLDKKDFYGGCGEVRFLYRLAYQDENGASSRLPFTLNLVMENTETDCRKVAQKWVQGESDSFVVERALNMKQLRFKQLEVNAQIVRFPSGLETDLRVKHCICFVYTGLRRVSRN